MALEPTACKLYLTPKFNMAVTRFLFCLLLLSCSAGLSAQIISGRIIDSATREPLGGASVYCQNTTLGSASNKQGEFSLELKPGGYDLVVTFTGYQARLLRINASEGRLADIEMSKEEKSLGEVVIKTSSEVKDGWVKYGGFFVDHFIGTTPNATQSKLLNPDALKFYLLKKSNKLRVLATEPLQIENQALGYVMRYELDSFIYNYNNDINSYRGYCLYTQLEGSDSLKKVWAANRSNAYQGSKLQFMRSLYDSTLTEDGWVVSLLDEQDNKKFIPVANVYDSAYYGGLDSTNQVELWFPRKASIQYNRIPAPEYLKQFKLPKNVLVQISYVDMREAIAIMQNGYFYDQRDWVNQGYWSWKNLADQLPYDYEP
ncbi:MAG: carboxypeptidase-like regulatory domain-containing protein [Chitinophagaceae bacterium]|nr:MAG: carboxypeptidase-like regulatory domain-containing protein [Chitinophagaceae bacterium]